MRWFFSLIFIYLHIHLTIAQQANERPIRHFATQQVEKELAATFPEVTEARMDIEKYIRSFRPVGAIKNKNIPIVFHIIRNSAEVTISEAQIVSQIEALNRDFSSQAFVPDFPANQLEGFLAKRPERLNISFCLAVSKPGANGQRGILYEDTNVAEWSVDNQIKYTNAGGSDPWSTEDYLNVWVSKLTDGVSGWAQLPGGPTATDGIVIDYRFFGTSGTAVAPYNEGKTLTHLVGSYLGLEELWNESIKCDDDKVLDTPLHNGPNIGCPVYRHVSTCYQYATVEMTMNFMDNTDDPCMYMFTFGQMLRMHAMLGPKGPRKMLANNGNLCYTEKIAGLNGATYDEHSSIVMQPKLSIQPNPSRGMVQFNIGNISNESAVLQVFDPNGRQKFTTAWETPATTSTMNLDCVDWPPGIYFVKVTGDGQVITERLVITR